jgi:poly(hydroxyalkanoate) depolymerase family esterase
VSFTLEQLLETSLLGNALAAPSTDDADDASNEPVLTLVRPSRSARASRSVDRRLRIDARSNRFIDDVFESESGALDYRLYPPVFRGTGDTSLIVMLHGAGQDHIDFARGTQMHEHPQAVDAFVLYPAQRANIPGRCWNWFRDSDQSRGRGEPAMLAALTRHIIAENDICPRRVYVAGLSAGAAMAVVLGQVYPELYAAVGAHSGIPYRVAGDMYAALDVMARGPSAPPLRRGGAAVPTIVFHGDADRTVHPANAGAIVADALDCCADHATTKPVSAARAPSRGVRKHTTTRFADAKGRSRVEQWVVHDAGHAWSGGSADGAYTDPAGPDATAEMLRFFRSHRLEPRCVR